MDLKVSDMVVVKGVKRIYYDFIADKYKDKDIFFGSSFLIKAVEDNKLEIKTNRYDDKNYKLVEIWRKADEETYKKIWSKEK